MKLAALLSVSLGHDSAVQRSDIARDVQVSFLKRLCWLSKLGLSFMRAKFYPSAAAIVYRCLPLGKVTHSIWAMTKEIRKCLRVSVKITFHVCWLCCVDVFVYFIRSECMFLLFHSVTVMSRVLVNYTVNQSALCIRLQHNSNRLRPRFIKIPNNER